MANEEYIRQITTHDRVACPACGGTGRTPQGLVCETCGGTGAAGATHRFGSVRRNVFAALVLTACGVVLVWVLMFLLSQG